jgi:hypothetical protein
MTETESESMPGHPETLDLEPVDLEPDQNPGPDEGQG